jgi:anthranilate phosphoribosyltransferase
LAALGIGAARSIDEAEAQLSRRGFAYLPLGAISPRLGELLALKPIIGLRSPFHTVAKALNPLDASCQMIGVAHPPYRALHQRAAVLIGQRRLAVFKGDGGEAERRPEKPLDVAVVADGLASDETWPALLAVSNLPHEDASDHARLLAVWSGAIADPAAEAMVTGTTAVALKTLGRAATQDEAQALAETMWRKRATEALKGAA